MREAAARPPYTPAGWRQLHPVVRQLVAVRFLRSVAQGALAVDFVLYLRALGWSPAAIGFLLTGGGIVGALLVLAVGPLSDRFGRRPFLLVYEAVAVLGTALVLFVHAAWVVAVVAAILGYGRGANGGAGPFAPAEQAWISQHIAPHRLGQVFSFNSAVTFWGMGMGSALAGLVPAVARLLPGPAAYEPLLGLTLLVAAINLWQIGVIREERVPRPIPVPAQGAADDDAAVHRRENRNLLLLTGINAVNALGISLFGPLLPLWFSIRFGVGPGAIGPVFGLTFLLTGVSSIATGALVDRVGLVAPIVYVRLVGVILLALLPLMPSYGWAAGLYVLRSVLNRGSVGARQAFGVGLVRPHRRGLASSLSGLSMRGPSAIGPGIGGWMLNAGALDLPLFLAAGLQLTYVVLFALAFGRQAGAARGSRAAD